MSRMTNLLPWNWEKTDMGNVEIVLSIVGVTLLVLVALKALTVGSDFNLLWWCKYRGKYTQWYFSDKAYTPLHHHTGNERRDSSASVTTP